MTFKQVSFFGNFYTLLENFRAIFQVVFNRETRFSESSLFKQPNLLFAETTWILENLLTVF